MKSIFCAVLGLLCLREARASYFTVFGADLNSFSVRPGLSQGGLVFGFYSDDVETIGWGRLTINTTDSSRQASDVTVMQAVGYLEGNLTQARVWQSYQGFITQFSGNVIPSSLVAWVNKNIAWARAQVAAAPQDEYWRQVANVFGQLDGIVAGYNSAAPANQTLDIIDFYLMSGDDAGDIISALQTKMDAGSDEYRQLAGYRSMRRSPMHSQAFGDHWGSHCSVIVKPTDDLQELYAAHTTWSGFGSMLRMYKIYNVNLQASSTVAVSTSFSAYPGSLSSIDDFYTLSSGLVVMETTNGLFNNSLYQFVVPETLLSWVRVVVANRMAQSGQDWTVIFAKHNSGTYNNQWQIIDYNQFTPGSPIRDNTLWIIEQIPGETESADVSDLLRTQKYFPSYNIPYFQHIFDVSGFPWAVQKYGSWFSYTEHPRAQIFAREHPKVQSLSGVKYIQRFNEWQTDPLSVGNAINAIASRGDLVNQTNPANPYLARSCFGGIDAKIGSKELSSNFASVAISGPTYYQQPYFQWTEEWADVIHVGQPELFNFDWYTFSN